MPVELRIETDGKTENQKSRRRRHRLAIRRRHLRPPAPHQHRSRRLGAQEPRPTSQVRIAILKGQQLVAQGDLIGALAEYQKALDANPQSSLASYRIGEVLLHPAQLPGHRQLLPRRPPRRRRAPLDRGLEPHRARQNLRHHRPARPRRQRVPPRRPDQRQHPGRRQRSPPVALQSPTSSPTPASNHSSSAGPQERYIVS